MSKLGNRSKYKIVQLVTIIVSFSLLLVGCAGGVSTSGGPLAVKNVITVQTANPSGAQAQALAAFGEQLFAQVKDGSDVNPVISPLSVFYALAMADEGAKDSTADAFTQVLGIPVDQARQVAAYLLTALDNQAQGTTVNVANSAWLDDSLKANQDWVDQISAYYQAAVFSTDLQAPATVDAVNQWISDKTNKMIPQMLQTIDSSAVALLINALYLNATWATQFNTDNTSDQMFTMASGSTATVPFMTMYASTQNVIDTDSAQGVVLPYQDGRLAFMAVMPKSGELSLSGDTLSQLLSAATQTDNVVLSMPKFHTEFGTTDLVPALTKLGLGVAFDPGTANLTGLGSSDGRPLYIGSVLHKVSISVGEKGTEAAAATVVEIMAGSAPLAQPLVIDFNRPYIYAVVDTQTGVPLFIGAMDDPSKAPPTVN